MPSTRMKMTSDGQIVTITYYDSDVDDVVTRTFGAPREFGYVHDLDTGEQVCTLLDSYGDTLLATRDTLPDVIRKEYRARVRRDRARFG